MTKQIDTLQALRSIFQEHAAKALTYQNKINAAKTDYKKSYYIKKLLKNNEEAIKVLTAITRIEGARNSKKDSQLTSDESTKST